MIEFDGRFPDGMVVSHLYDRGQYEMFQFGVVFFNSMLIYLFTESLDVRLFP